MKRYTLIIREQGNIENKTEMLFNSIEECTNELKNWVNDEPYEIYDRILEDIVETNIESNA